MLIADTSGLLASIDRNDRHHEAVRSALLAERDAVVVPELVLAELDASFSSTSGERRRRQSSTTSSRGLHARALP